MNVWRAIAFPKLSLDRVRRGERKRLDIIICKAFLSFLQALFFVSVLISPCYTTVFFSLVVVVHLKILYSFLNPALYKAADDGAPVFQPILPKSYDFSGTPLEKTLGPTYQVRI